MRILVVGSGTAGLVSSIILKKRFSHFDVDVVSSKDIGIIGVGEGSTEHFREFLDFAGIDPYDLLVNTDATFKSSIFFEGWGKNNYFHNVATPFNSKIGQYSVVYAKQISEQTKYLYPEKIKENKINSWFLNKSDNIPYNQFHFNTFKLNEYLINFAKKIGINFYEDIIESVEIGANGHIKSIDGSHKKYNYDFYIDTTGFKRILLSKYNPKWKSFSEYLKMNSAVTFQMPDTEEYNLWTLSKSMDNGWMFKIPVWGRSGNGYIYDKNYADEEKIILELNQTIGSNIEVGKRFSFDPGYIETPWINNCLAIGLSSSFVEPLEATSIGTSIQQSFMLMHKIVNYSKKDIELYNKSFIDIMNNIRDFVFLHYMVNDDKSLFWKDMSKQLPPNDLSEMLTVWKNRLPISEDFNEYSQYCLFHESNFIILLDGIKWFSVEAIKNEYDYISDDYKNFAKQIVENEKNIENFAKFIGHKEFLSISRQIYC
jgi:tryptophan halogenase